MQFALTNCFTQVGTFFFCSNCTTEQSKGECVSLLHMCIHIQFSKGCVGVKSKLQFPLEEVKNGDAEFLCKHHPFIYKCADGASSIHLQQ